MPRRRVGSRLVIGAQQPLDMILQLAVSDMTGAAVRETLVITRDGEPLKAREVTLPGEGRAHVVTVDSGRVTVDYQATLDGRAFAPEVAEANRLPSWRRAGDLNGAASARSRPGLAARPVQGP